MKQLAALVAFASSAMAAQGTVHTVTCQNGAYHFLPVTVNANVGDTIHWTWVSGNHVVGPILETDIPALADTWLGVIDATYNDYEYVVAFPGSYHYVCHPFAPHGEDGYINVASTMAMQEAQPLDCARLYPNPFNEQLTLEASGATNVRLYNALGDEVRSFSVASGRTLLRADLGTLPDGLYLVSILRNGVMLETKRMVKE